MSRLFTPEETQQLIITSDHAVNEIASRTLQALGHMHAPQQRRMIAIAIAGIIAGRCDSAREEYVRAWGEDLGLVFDQLRLAARGDHETLVTRLETLENRPTSTN